MLIYILLVGLLTSCYLFPFEFTFLPGVNTKMIAAAVSLVVLALQIALRKVTKVDKDFFTLTVVALVLSLICFTAVVVNGTNDHTYSTYIVSMWVWWGGAYLVTTVMKKVHGYLSVLLVSNYLIAVCVVQCLIALVIDFSPIVENAVNSVIVGFDFVELERLGDSGRLYGIGAALDVAGTRFSSVLVIIAVICLNLKNKSSVRLWVYLLAFIVIAIVGNMIARTTTVGLVLASLYWLVVPKQYVPNGKSRLILSFGALLLCVIPYLINKFETNSDFRDQLTFAFEGFFSLAESGVWDVASNNNLKSMVVFPNDLKTWIIGDGYLENPRVTDPYYVGEFFHGYYMGTDIGYLRFIFYFGIFGLLTFMFFFYKVASICARKHPKYKMMFFLILIINYVIWLKVATDIFVVFAIFLCIPEENIEEVRRLPLLPTSESY